MQPITLYSEWKLFQFFSPKGELTGYRGIPEGIHIATVDCSHSSAATHLWCIENATFLVFKINVTPCKHFFSFEKSCLAWCTKEFLWMRMQVISLPTKLPNSLSDQLTKSDQLHFQVPLPAINKSSFCFIFKRLVSIIYNFEGRKNGSCISDLKSLKCLMIWVFSASVKKLGPIYFAS